MHIEQDDVCFVDPLQQGLFVQFLDMLANPAARPVLVLMRIQLDSMYPRQVAFAGSGNVVQDHSGGRRRQREHFSQHFDDGFGWQLAKLGSNTVHCAVFVYRVVRERKRKECVMCARTVI